MGEKPTFTPAQEQRLGQFQKVIGDLEKATEHITNGEKFNCQFNYNDGRTDLLFPIDQRFVNIWKHRMADRYSAEFKPDPDLKQAADETVNDVAYRAHLKDLSQKAELHNIWNGGK